jgi:type 1 fimbriae regulatory protein FimB/type 1 fimbriae regulatory protein FimE
LLRELRRQHPDSAFVFATERGGPFTPDAINRLIKRIGERARFAFPVHVHMLRHAPAAMRSPMPATTRGRYRIGSAISRSSTPCATPS